MYLPFLHVEKLSYFAPYVIYRCPLRLVVAKPNFKPLLDSAADGLGEVLNTHHKLNCHSVYYSTNEIVGSGLSVVIFARNSGARLYVIPIRC